MKSALCSASLVAFALTLVIPACSDSTTSTPPPGAPDDAGADDASDVQQPANDDAGKPACNDLPLPAFVTPERSDAGLPAGQGGTIVPGLYQLTRAVLTNPNLPLTTIGVTTRCTATHMESINAFGDGTVIRSRAPYTLSGTEILFGFPDCGPRGRNVEYTATADTLEIMCTSCGFHYVLTRQP